MIAKITTLPAFGIVLSIVVYLFYVKIAKKVNHPLFNPLLMSIFTIMAILMIFKIPYESYNEGGKYITFLIAPATVAMIVNLYKNLDLFKKNIIPVLLGVTAGVLTAVISVIIMAKLFGLERSVEMSMIPKSLTTAIGVNLSEEYGGIAGLTVMAIMITGISGGVMAPIVMKVFKVTDPVAKGVGMGTSAHAVGTSRAIEMGEVEGAMSGLSIALAGFVSVILIPILIKLLV